MPITPRGLARLKRPLSFDYYGSTVNVEYHPGAFDQALLDRWNAVNERMVAAGEDEDKAQACALDFARLFCEMLGGWDYCEEGPSESEPGPPVPLEPERILREFLTLPLTFPAFMLAVVEAVTGDMRRSKESAPDSSAQSGATSSPKATSTSSPAASSRKRSRSSSRRAGSVVAARQ